MRKLIALLILALPAAFPQTAVYPSGVVTDNQLRVAVNNVSTTLTFPMLSADTTISVANATGIVLNSTVTIDNEKIAICQVSGNTLTVGKSSCPNVDGRGFDGTSATSHANGAAVSLNIDAWHHNASKAEIEAIESELGANMSNVPGTASGPTVPLNKLAAVQGNGTKVQLAGTNSGVSGAPLCNDAGGNTTTTCTPVFPSGAQTQILQIQPNVGNTTTYRWVNRPMAWIPDFAFPAQTPGGSLAAGANTITLSPMPLGITAAAVTVGGLNRHWLYISAGTGTAEAVPIIGWTSTTVTVQCANTHTGAWTIQSATGGIQEAIEYAWANALAAGYLGSAFNQGATQSSNIDMYGPVYVPPGWGNVIDIEGVNLTVRLTNPALDAWTFDTFDFSTYHIGNQIYWPGQPNGSAIFRFNPQNPNGEGATGIFTSDVRFGVVVPAQLSGAPGTQGYAIRVTTSGGNINGLNLAFDQINGGQYGIYVDTPANAKGFNGNYISGYLNSAGVTEVQIGTSAPGANQLTANTWRLLGYTAPTAFVDTYGGGDTFLASLSGGNGTGFIFESSSIDNAVFSSNILTSAQWSNAGKGNRLFMGGVATRTAPAVGASPYTYVNTSGRPIGVFLSGSSTQVGLGSNYNGTTCTTFDNATSPPANTYYTLQPDMCIQITYGGAAPNLFLYK